MVSFPFWGGGGEMAVLGRNYLRVAKSCILDNYSSVHFSGKKKYDLFEKKL